MKTEDFIGPAQKRAEVLSYKGRRLKRDGGENLRLLLYGPPGSGKTALAEMLGATLANHSSEIQRVNGRNVTIELTREWMQSIQYQSVLGGWTVRLIDEVDLCTTAAQDLLLSYLDRLPSTHAVIATSNLDVGSLTERFQTRFQQMRVELPDTATLSGWLANQWGIPSAAASAIAVGSGGNVRAALLDVQTFIDESI